ncbi:MAG: hypothetical protein IKX42_06665 [Fibrobacter sp.]|nr:hypothetical protein [Fibrobacter sp.]
MNWNRFYVLAVFAGAALLGSCGDDDSSSSAEGNASGIASVATFDDLAHCTKSRYGEVVYVENEETYFECNGGDWTEVDSAKVDSIIAECSSSVESSSSAKSSSSVREKVADTAVVELVKVDSVAVSGFAQKGPFESGSVVTVYGLDSLLEKTKTKFTGKVTGDSGAYSVSKIVLPSQYALVEVNGFYKNENTGKKTSGTKVTLNALVDLSEGKSVKANVNVFTEMEYARVKHLVLKEKYNVPAAKIRATKELVEVFGGNSSSDIVSTDLSLSDTGAVGKSLLIASVLLQGDLSASKLGLRLGKVSDLFAATGAIKNDSLFTEFADWASDMDDAGKFDTLRANIKAMNLSSNVPEFEGFLYNLWTTNYGLGECNKDNEFYIRKNENKASSNFDEPFACTGNRWHRTSEIDAELGMCSSVMEGVYKQSVSDDYYACHSGVWHKVTKVEYELKDCTAERQNKYESVISNRYFVCLDSQWQEIDDATYYLKFCTPSRNNEYGSFSDKYYVCLDSQWKKLDKVTYDLKLCTEERRQEMGTATNYKSYVCEWDGQKGTWRMATDLELDIGACDSSKNGRISKTKTGSYYLCKNESWESSTVRAYEIQALGACDSQNEYTIMGTPTQGLFVCEYGAWRQTDKIESLLGMCQTKASIDTVFKVKLDGVTSYYKCHTDLYWQEVTEWTYNLYKLGECRSSNNLTMKASVSMGNYVCENGSWRKATDIENVAGVCTSARTSDSAVVSGELYVCSNEHWRYATEYENQIGVCTSAREGEYAIYSYYESGETLNKYYQCTNLKWGEVSRSTYLYNKPGTCNSTTKKDTLTLSGVKYYCDNPESNSYNYSWLRMVLKDTRDNQQYPIVRIENDIWMAKNLNYRYHQKTYNGAAGDTSSYCYDNLASNCAKYGRLYIWSAAMDSVAKFSTKSRGCGYGKSCSPTYPVQGVCPKGWHLPTKAEWSALRATAKDLKSKTEWNGDNTYGFNALPSGYYFNGAFRTEENGIAYFWTSSEYISDVAYSVNLTYFEEMFMTSTGEANAISVRCVRD